MPLLKEIAFDRLFRVTGKAASRGFCCSGFCRIAVFLVLFFFGACAPPQESQVLIPVQLENIPDGLSVSGLSDPVVEVRIRGSETALHSFAEMKPVYRMDLSAAENGVQSLPVEPRDIPVVKGMAVLETDPAFITLTVEKETFKTVPVAVSVTGNPASGYRLTGAEASPRQIELAGPETLVIPIKEAVAKPIDIGGRTEPFRKAIALDLPEYVRVVHQNGMIAGDIRIEPNIVERKIGNIRVTGKGTSYGFEINPPTLEISVRGPENQLKVLGTAGDLKVYVDLTALKPGVYVRRATIALPVHLSLVDVKPELFTVKITRGASVNPNR